MQEKSDNSNPVVKRLRRYQVSQGLTWNQVAEKLKLSRGMLMMVLREDRHLSPKALFRLEQAERDVADRRSAAQQTIDFLLGDDDVVGQIIGRDKSAERAIDVPVEYKNGRTSKGLPTKISLQSPTDEDRRKLRCLFAETLDTRLIALACMPKQFRVEGFLNQLTGESRTRLTKAALELVIPNWRTLVTSGM